jgi:prepilin-type N-terminal cleavage/methylation domain-containing protein
MQITTKKGFTLIELLVVIAIIGLLSTLAVVSLNNAREKSRDAKRVSDIRQIQTGLELYYADRNGYPVVPTGGIILGGSTAKVLSFGGGTGSGAAFAALGGGTAPIYLGNIPANPEPGGANYVYNSKETNGTTNCTTHPCPSYAITFNLQGQTGQLAPGNRTASPSGIQ